MAMRMGHSAFLGFISLLLKSCPSQHCRALGGTARNTKEREGFVGLLLLSRSVGSNSLRPHRLQPARLHCPGILQGVFLTQESNPRLLHWEAGSLLLSHQGSPASGPLGDLEPEALGSLETCERKLLRWVLFEQASSDPDDCLCFEVKYSPRTPISGLSNFPETSMGGGEHRLITDQAQGFGSRCKHHFGR